MSEVQDPPIKRPADPFPSYAALRARHSELLDLEPETESDAAYLEEIQDFFERVRATGAILAIGEERRASQSILNYWTSVLYHADRKPSNTTLVELNPELKPKLEDQTCPYPGVREFDESEGKYFFGRQRTIDYLLARLKEESFLALVGPSGNGKSSFVRAGLVPAIKRIGLEEEHDEVQRHFFPIITPGSDPLTNLASLLSGAIKSPESLPTEHYREKLQQNSQYLADFLAETLIKPAVIVVDQFEELFTLCKDRDARRIFIDNLLALDRTKHRVILCTNIEDFGAALKRVPEFEKSFERGQTLLARLGVAELTDAIIKPADLVGFKFKDKTVKDIVQEIGTLPLALPLLQFTLVKLWEKRGTHDEYFAASGGCRMLLIQYAEEFLLSLEPGERDLAENIFREMVKFKYKYQAHLTPVELEAYAVPVRVKDLVAELGRPEQVGAMVERLGNAQLLRRSHSLTPGDQQIELVSDTLVQNWPRLSGWVTSQKRQRFKVAIVTLALLLIAVVLGSSWAGLKAGEWWEKRKAHDRALALAAASRRQLSDRRFDTAMLQGLAAYRIDPHDDNVRARGALLSTALFYPRPRAFLPSDDRLISEIAISPDGKYVAGTDDSGNIVIWDVDTRRLIGQPISNPVAPAKNPISDPLAPASCPIIFSDTGKWLVTGGIEESVGPGGIEQSVGAAAIWDAATRTKTKIFKASKENEQIVALAVSPDDKILAGVDKNGKVVIWDIDTETTIPGPKQLSGRITAVAFSPAGILAIGYDNGTVRRWDAKLGGVPRRMLRFCNCGNGRSGNAITSIVFSTDGTIAVGSIGGTILWRPGAGGGVTELAGGPTDSEIVLSFSEYKGGKTLTGFANEDQIYMWDIPDDQIEDRVGEKIFRPIGRASKGVFSRDGKMLAANNALGITLWDVSRPRVTRHDDSVSAIAFSPDGKLLASGTEKGSLYLVDAVSGETIIKLLPDQSPIVRGGIVSLAFSPDSSLLAAGLLTGRILVMQIERDQNEEDQIEGDQLKLVFDAQATQEGRDSSWNVTSIAFTSPASLVSFNKTPDGGKAFLETWDLNSKSRKGEPFPIPLETNKLDAAILSPGGQFLSLATDNRKVSVWNVEKLTKIHESETDSKIVSLVFSANEHLLILGGEDQNQIFVYKLGESKPSNVILGDLSANMDELASSGDGSVIAVGLNPPRSASAPSDSMVVLVDLNLGQVIGDPIKGHALPVSALALNSDGKTLATGGNDKATILWDLNTCTAAAKVCEIVNRPFSKQEGERYDLKDINACNIEAARKECPTTK